MLDGYSAIKFFAKKFKVADGMIIISSALLISDLKYLKYKLNLKYFDIKKLLEKIIFIPVDEE